MRLFLRKLIASYWFVYRLFVYFTGAYWDSNNRGFHFVGNGFFPPVRFTKRKYR